MAIPIDQMMPMAESSRMWPLSEAHSIPIAERMAKIIAPPMGLKPATQKDHTSSYDVGADDAAHDARKDCGQKGVHQVLILEYVGKKLHCTLKTRTNLL